MIEKRVKFGDYLSNRMDVSFYQDRFNFSSTIYPSFRLSELLFVNPTVKYENLSENDSISFVPMEVVDEKNGKIAEQRETSISKTKGFTRFKENDLIWAKITPCMQNEKSAIARNLTNGYGCGSTEFYVLRPKKDNVLIEYIHFILRDKRVLKSAKNSFGGSAGQQRVPSGYLKSIEIPLPPIEIQQKIVDLYNDAVKEKQAKEQEAKTLLDSIDDYLLKELGIELPENSANERYFKANISKLIGEQLDVKSTRFKTYKRKSIKYDEVFLSEIASITKGKSITKDKIIDGDYPVIAGGQTSPYSHSEYNEVENAITISASGAYSGYVWFHDYKIFASDCSVVRSKDETEYLTSYIYSILKIKQDEIYRTQKGAGQPHVYSTDIAAITIPIIDIKIQQEIV
ncbi:MAG: restriction endonuclease subunit S, partial [Dysgonamonadaceae bacterium]|nr:restriction endonuclease subunit S [Dysgonamonadaceae bacterium]